MKANQKGKTNRIYIGLGVLMKYKGVNTSQDDYRILCGSEERVTTEDHVYLESIGWLYDEEYDCYGIFV